MNQPGKTRVVVAMSGGVDSSVAALSLCAEGYEVIGLTMQVWEHGPDGRAAFRGCCSPEDVYDARRVAEQLGIPFYVVNFQERFAEKVVKPFVADYLAGRTPNPCVLCNREIKFQDLLARAAELGADYLATGHYARILGGGAGAAWRMFRGRDANKDQSYFLFTLTQAQLGRTLFPLGELSKTEVRGRARQAGLEVKDKPESQEICFVDAAHYSDFVRARLGPKHLNGEGEIVDLEGRRRGRHQGIYRYTIGQRRGLGISASEPLYVVALDPENNLVKVGPESALYHRRVLLRGVHWIAGEPVPPRKEVQVKVRYRAPARPARVEPVGGGVWRLLFSEPERAVTPGQAAVIYSGEEVLGGGWIEGWED